MIPLQGFVASLFNTIVGFALTIAISEIIAVIFRLKFPSIWCILNGNRKLINSKY